MTPCELPHRRVARPYSLPIKIENEWQDQSTRDQGINDNAVQHRRPSIQLAQQRQVIPGNIVADEVSCLAQAGESGFDLCRTKLVDPVTVEVGDDNTVHLARSVEQTIGFGIEDEA